MRKWAKQGFLNGPDSNDDGWYKFSIRPKSDKYRIGMGIQYIISDCSNKIYLEFEPEYVTLDELDGGVAWNRIKDAKAAIKSAQTRKKKIQDFADAVALSAEKIIDALDSFEAKVQHALDIAAARD